jgi:hypothetical protein
MPGFAGAHREGRGTKYNWAHQKERARLKPIVERGEAWCQQGRPGNGSSGRCLKATRWIAPGSRWVLGHNDAGTAWIGPCHHACNHQDAAVRGGRAALAKRRRRAGTPTIPIMGIAPRRARPSRNW